LAIASGSLRELETHLQIAQRLGYLSEVRLKPLLASIDEVARMIYAMLSKIRAKQTGSTVKSPAQRRISGP